MQKHYVSRLGFEPKTCPLRERAANQLSQVELPHQEFVERCLSCNGTFPSMRFDPSKKDQRVPCAIYKRKTKHYCWGCRRYLCSEPPQNGKKLHGRKFPKNFSVKVPKVKEDGTLEGDNKCNFIFQTERGVLSCYHITPMSTEKNNYENKPIMSAVSESTKESSAESGKQGRST